jgi:hypothetical protein
VAFVESLKEAMFGKKRKIKTIIQTGSISFRMKNPEQ